MRFLVIVAIAFLGAFCAQAQELLRVDPGVWVEELQVPVPSPDRASDAGSGFRDLIFDTQVRWLGDEHEVFQRLVRTVTAPAGLKAAGSINLLIDPASQRLALNRVDILRDGRRISLRDEIGAEFYRRETQLEQGIVTGLLTLHVEVPGLQVCDTVDIGFTYIVRPVIEGAAHVLTHDLAHPEPTALSRLLLHWPKAIPFRSRLTMANELTYAEHSGDATIRREWRRADLSPPPAEAAVPPGHSNYASVEVSPHSDWGPIVQALLPHYTADYPLPEDWQTRVSTIAAASLNDAERVIAALRMVQDEIRYVGVEVGAGGYFARAPETVAQQRFGDCKDKALLLATILANLGIEAEVALASLGQGQALRDRLPSIRAFDHMILRAKVDGDWHWMDPTATHEGGTLATSAVPLYGYVLPISPGETELFEIAPSSTSVFRVQSMTTVAFLSDEVRLSVQSTYVGVSANWARASLAETTPQLFDATSREALAQYYPGIETLALPVVEDDLAGNRLSVFESYGLSMTRMEEFGLASAFPFVGWGFSDLFPDISGIGRQSPMVTPHPYEAQVGVLVTGAPINFEPPEPVELENAAFGYRFAGAAMWAGQMSLNWSMVSRSAQVPARDVAQVLRHARTTETLALWTWELPSPTAPDPEAWMEGPLLPE